MDFSIVWSLHYAALIESHSLKAPLEIVCAVTLWVGTEVSRLMIKPTKWHVRPAKTQISLGIHPVWSVSSLAAWRKLGSLATHWVQSKDWSDWADAQADLSLRCAHSHFVGFVMRRLKCVSGEDGRVSLKSSGKYHLIVNFLLLMEPRMLKSRHSWS